MLLLWQGLDNFSESVFEIFGNEVLRIIKTMKPHGENIHSYPHFPFFHRSFIYRKAFLYTAVNCGKFENIPVPGVMKSWLSKHFVISRNVNYLFLFILWLGICVDVAVDRISRLSINHPLPPPPFTPSLCSFCLFVLFLFHPTHSSLFNTSDSYLKSVRA